MFFLLLQNVSFLNALSRPLFAYFIINDKRWKTLPTAGSELWFLCCWKYHINCQTSNVLWLNVTFKGYWTADLRYYKWLFYQLDWGRMQPRFKCVSIHFQNQNTFHLSYVKFMGPWSVCLPFTLTIQVPITLKSTIAWQERK